MIILHHNIPGKPRKPPRTLHGGARLGCIQCILDEASGRQKVACEPFMLFKYTRHLNFSGFDYRMIIRPEAIVPHSVCSARSAMYRIVAAFQYSCIKVEQPTQGYERTVSCHQKIY